MRECPAGTIGRCFLLTCSGAFAGCPPQALRLGLARSGIEPHLNAPAYLLRLRYPIASSDIFQSGLLFVGNRKCECLLGRQALRPYKDLPAQVNSEPSAHLL